jgi:predicted membrane chloride channel (bestrophin family)
MTGTFADQLAATANIANLVTVQQTLLLACIVLPFGFVAYALVVKGLKRAKGN